MIQIKTGRASQRLSSLGSSLWISTSSIKVSTPKSVNALILADYDGRRAGNVGPPAPWGCRTIF
jgi:hypothetical protein